MAHLNFIKTVWDANIQTPLRKALVFGGVANTQYEGQVNQLGDKVRMIQTGNVTINAYTRGQALTRQTLNDAAADLVADQSHYFDFEVNDVDAVQAKQALLTGYTDSAAYGFRDVIDAYIAGLHAEAGLHNYATGTTPWDVTSANVEDAVLAVDEQMSTANIPQVGRYLIVPEWFKQKIILATLDHRFDNTNAFDNGMIGKFLGFDILVSNNVSHTVVATGDHAKIFAGVRNVSLTLAQALTNVEAFRPEAAFADAVKGFLVYGAKVARPDMLCVLHADKTSG